MKLFLYKCKRIIKSADNPKGRQILESVMPKWKSSYMHDNFNTTHIKIKNITGRNFLNAPLALTLVSLSILLASTRQISSSLYRGKLHDHIRRCGLARLL